MKSTARLFAALELSLLFLLWVLTIWVAWKFSGASVWTAAGILAMALTVLCSIAVRRPGWRASGFRLDNFWPALMRVGLVTLGVVILFAAGGRLAGLSLSPLSGTTVVRFLVSGLLQQAFFLGYLFHRWDALFQNPWAAVAANALSFAFIHLPQPWLVMITAAGGFFFSAFFVRVRNVFILGLAHGVLFLFTASWLYHAGLIASARVGPAPLAPLSETIARALAPGDRIGICSRILVPRQFGRTFDRPIEQIGHRVDANNSSLQDSVRLFLTGKERVFCIITERDFNRYAPPELRKRLFILGERYTWKHRLVVGNREFAMDFFYGQGDAPIIAAFRDRVLLVSNKP